MKFTRGKRYAFFHPSLAWPPLRWWHVLRWPHVYLRFAIVAWKARRNPKFYFTVTSVENKDGKATITIEEKP